MPRLWRPWVGPWRFIPLLSRIRIRIADAEEVDAHIAAFYERLNGIEDQPTRTSRLLFDLARSLSRRYEHTGDARDLDRFIAGMERLLHLQAPTPLGRQFLLEWVAASLWIRYLEREDAADLDGIIDALTEAVANPDREAVSFAASESLARAYDSRYERRQQVSDLNEAISNFRGLLRDIPATDPRNWEFTAGLVARLGDRYDRQRDVSDLDEAIDLLERTAGAETLWGKETRS